MFEVVAERKRQDSGWGEQNHELPIWLAILMEEVGELAELHCLWPEDLELAARMVR